MDQFYEDTPGCLHWQVNGFMFYKLSPHECKTLKEAYMAKANILPKSVEDKGSVLILEFITNDKHAKGAIRKATWDNVAFKTALLVAIRDKQSLTVDINTSEHDKYVNVWVNPYTEKIDIAAELAKLGL